MPLKCTDDEPTCFSSIIPRTVSAPAKPGYLPRVTTSAPASGSITPHATFVPPDACTTTVRPPTYRGPAGSSVKSFIVRLTTATPFASEYHFTQSLHHGSLPRPS